MHWGNIPPLIIDDVVALVVGYSATIIAAVMLKKRGHRAAFIRQHWLDMVGLTFAAVFGTAAATFLVVVPILLVSRGLFGMRFSSADVWTLACTAYVVIFVLSVSYYAWRIAKEDVA